VVTVASAHLLAITCPKSLLIQLGIVIIVALRQTNEGRDIIDDSRGHEEEGMLAG
jgi:hypothetical protein